MQSPRPPLCFVNRFVSFKRDRAKYYPSECFLIPRDDNYKKGHKNICLRGFLTNEILFLLSKEIVCCWKRLLSTRPELPRTQNPVNSVNCREHKTVNCREPRAILKWATPAHLKRTLTSNQYAKKSPTFGSSEYSQFGSVFASHILKGLWTLSSKGNISAPRKVQPRKVTTLSNFDNIGISAQKIRLSLKSPQVLGANHFVWTCHPVFLGVSEKKGF